MVTAPTSIPTRLIDAYGRQMGDLRISITDRCNFRCVYCMPEEGLQWLKNDKILTFEEITRLARLFVRMGIRGLRITGGEPTVRAHLPDLIGMLAPLRDEGLESLSLTTNGFRLKQLAGPLADAGLTRINVSLDSLVREKFHKITRRDCLEQVLEGLAELERHPTIRPIKVNAVAMRGFTEDEVIPFAELSRRQGYVVRFIEYMPLDADGGWKREQVLAGREIYEMIDAWKPLVPLQVDASSTSRVYRFSDGIGEVGFINPVSEPFCARCDRLRITADGQIRTCLFSLEEWDLCGPMRAGASDEELGAIVQAAVSQKELKHKINEGENFKRASRSMSQIGG